MRVRLTVPGPLVNEKTLGAAAEAATEIAQAYIEAGDIPPLADLLAAGRLQWAPETAFGGKPGLESFDPPGVVLARGGLLDCDDIAPWWAAELRASDVDPEAKAIVYQSGPNRWHVVTQRGDGSIDDPSRWAGMGRKEGAAPAATEPITNGVEDAVVGFTRAPSGTWRARIDVPTYDGCGVAVERAGFDPYDALARAVGDISMAIFSHWGAPDFVLAKLAAVNDILHNGPHPDADYGAHGQFVHNLAQAVGALKMSVDPSQAANLAATIVDPLGLRNLLPGLANTFVSNYASSLAQRGAQPAATTSGDDPCPPGWHWEYHGGVNICVRDSVSGDWAGYQKSQKKKSSAGSGSKKSGGRGSSSSSSQRGRGSSSSSSQQQDPNYDPSTGLTYDPSSGYFYDAQGNWYDQNGWPLYASQPSYAPQYPQYAPPSYYGGGYGYGPLAPQSQYGYGAPAQYYGGYGPLAPQSQPGYYGGGYGGY